MKLKILLLLSLYSCYAWTNINLMNIPAQALYNGYAKNVKHDSSSSVVDCKGNGVSAPYVAINSKIRNIIMYLDANDWLFCLKRDVGFDVSFSPPGMFVMHANEFCTTSYTAPTSGIYIEPGSQTQIGLTSYHNLIDKIYYIRPGDNNNPRPGSGQYLGSYDISPYITGQVSSRDCQKELILDSDVMFIAAVPTGSLAVGNIEENINNKISTSGGSILTDIELYFISNTRNGDLYKIDNQGNQTLVATKGTYTLPGNFTRGSKSLTYTDSTTKKQVSLHYSGSRMCGGQFVFTNNADIPSYLQGLASYTSAGFAQAYQTLITGISNPAMAQQSPGKYYSSKLLSLSALSSFAQALAPSTGSSSISLGRLSSFEKAYTTSYVKKHLATALKNLVANANVSVSATHQASKINYNPASFGGVVITEVFNNTQTTFAIEQDGTLIGLLIPGRNEVALYGAAFSGSAAGGDILFSPLDANYDPDTTKASWRVSFQTGKTVKELAGSTTFEVQNTDPFLCVQITDKDLPSSMSSGIKESLVRSQVIGLSELQGFATVSLKVEDHIALRSNDAVITLVQSNAKKVADEKIVPCFYPSIVYMQQADALIANKQNNNEASVQDDIVSKFTFPLLFLPKELQANEAIQGWQHIINAELFALQLGYKDFSQIQGVKLDDLFADPHLLFLSGKKYYMYRDSSDVFGLFDRKNEMTFAELLNTTKDNFIKNQLVMFHAVGSDSSSNQPLTYMSSGFIGELDISGGDIPTIDQLTWYDILQNLNSDLQKPSISMNVLASQELPESYVSWLSLRDVCLQQLSENSVLAKILQESGEVSSAQTKMSLIEGLFVALFPSKNLYYNLMLGASNNMQATLITEQDSHSNILNLPYMKTLEFLLEIGSVRSVSMDGPLSFVNINAEDVLKNSMSKSKGPIVVKPSLVDLFAGLQVIENPRQDLLGNTIAVKKGEFYYSIASIPTGFEFISNQNYDRGAIALLLSYIVKNMPDLISVPVQGNAKKYVTLSTVDIVNQVLNNQRKLRGFVFVSDTKEVVWSNLPNPAYSKGGLVGSPLLLHDKDTITDMWLCPTFKDGSSAQIRVDANILKSVKDLSSGSTILHLSVVPGAQNKWNATITAEQYTPINPSSMLQKGEMLFEVHDGEEFRPVDVSAPKPIVKTVSTGNTLPITLTTKEDAISSQAITEFHIIVKKGKQKAEKISVFCDLGSQQISGDVGSLAFWNDGPGSWSSSATGPGQYDFKLWLLKSYPNVMKVVKEKPTKKH